ncbi:MAG: PilT/PilU family type 4a pilus ATPase [Clostridia bacterium]|nr:PilT/PilU family type 4a pilus ATPase [Clostridia bacterium]
MEDRTTYNIKLCSASETVREIYNRFKNEVMQYRRVDGQKISYSVNNLSENFRLGNKLILKFKIYGNGLRILFGLDPNNYSVDEYNHKNLKDIKGFGDVPMQVRLENETHYQKALVLLQDLTRLNNLVIDDFYENKDYLVDFPSLIIKKQKDVSNAKVEENVQNKVNPLQQKNYDSFPFIKEIFDAAVANNASDIHLKTNERPYIRKHGKLIQIMENPITEEMIYTIIVTFTSQEKLDRFNRENQVDCSFSWEDLRVRCNFYRDNNGCNASMRILSTKLKSFEELGIPLQVKKMVEHRSGLVIVTGPTGCGKSTTLSAVIDYLNTEKNLHIITLEDPIEFFHKPKNCIITQREIGRDTDSYISGLSAALREDPDVIMIGEMRDYHSIEIALRAAETGHLVLATLHTRGAINAVDRIIDVFPADMQEQARATCAMTLIGVMSQELLPTKDGNGRVLAPEILLCSNAIKNLIRTGKTFQIESSMQMSGVEENILLKKTLERLYLEGKISAETRDEYLRA